MGHTAEADILVHIRRNNNKSRAFLPGLPDGHACFDPIRLGNIIGGKDYAMPLLLAAAHSQRLVTQFWMPLHLYCSVKAVHIAVQNMACHSTSPPNLHIRTFVRFWQ